MQRPMTHWSAGGQSASVVHEVVPMQPPLMHWLPPGHCAEVVQPLGGTTTSGSPSLLPSTDTHEAGWPTSRSPAPLSTDRTYKFASQAAPTPITPSAVADCTYPCGDPLMRMGSVSEPASPSASVAGPLIGA
jgi:hypothetical protein